MGGVTEFARLLGTVQVVGLDTMPFIYHFEGHPVYGPLTHELFSRIEGGALRACTSVLSVSDVLTDARKAGDGRLAQIYLQVFELLPNLDVRPIDQDCAVLAADLRVEWGLRTPDAVQVAAAIQGGAQLFVTNDSRVRRLSQVKVIVLGDYV